jgi:ABC-type protease/lipase transport system fused ATPase/permease subunit
VIGPSAAGKSTLARLLIGAWPPNAGHVRLDGMSIGHWLNCDGARHLGYLPQDIELFSGSVRHNIARLADAPAADVIEAAKLAGMHEMIMRFEHGYDTEIGESGLKLSGGQRQRLALARAIFGKPSLLILDEPNSSLDSDGEDCLVRCIEHMKALGTTVVVIAHRASILNQADKLLLLRQGAAEVFGPREDVIARLNQAHSPPRERTVPLAPPKSMVRHQAAAS